MSYEESIQRSIANAVASVEMEGLHVDPSYIKYCEKLLKSEITFEQYLNFVKAKSLNH